MITIAICNSCRNLFRPKFGATICDNCKIKLMRPEQVEELEKDLEDLEDDSEESSEEE